MAATLRRLLWILGSKYVGRLGPLPPWNEFLQDELGRILATQDEQLLTLDAIEEISRLAPGLDRDVLLSYVYWPTAEEAPPLGDVFPSAAEEAPPLGDVFQSVAEEAPPLGEGDTPEELHTEEARPLEEASDESSLQREGLGSRGSLADVSEWAWPLQDMKRPEEARPLDPPPRAPDDPLYCPTCDLWLNGPDQLTDHVELVSRKHRRKLFDPEAWRRMLEFEFERPLSEAQWEHARWAIEERLEAFRHDRSLMRSHIIRSVSETLAEVANWEAEPEEARLLGAVFP